MLAFVVAPLLLGCFAPALCVSVFPAPVQNANTLAGSALVAAPDADEESGRKHLMARDVFG